MTAMKSGGFRFKFSRLGEFEAETAAFHRGGFRFKFSRLGEWVDVIIDDKLPTKRRARPSDTGEWWVPLTEKAYAKFNGGYEKLIGGQTCRALTDLRKG